jgi:outer membrane protein assembly factor BamB
MNHRHALLVAIGCTACAPDHKLETIVESPPYRSFSTETLNDKLLQPGTLFFTDGSDPESPRIVEVNREGEVVWQHRVPRALINSNTIMDAEPTPSGGAIFIMDAIGVIEVNRAGEEVRRFESMLPSHDADILDNGNWLCTNGWARVGEPHFMEVDPSGQVVWSWDGLAQYDREPYNRVYREGWIHANAAERMSDGATLVSLRNFNTVAMLEPNGDVRWELMFNDIDPEVYYTDAYDVARGAKPHDPSMTADGTVLVAVKEPNILYEIDPSSREVVWSWSPETNGSLKMRDANRLPNGNTLVTSTETILEVTSDGEVVWRLDADLSIIGEDGPTDPRPFYKTLLIDTEGVTHGS